MTLQKPEFRRSHPHRDLRRRSALACGGGSGVAVVRGVGARGVLAAAGFGRGVRRTSDGRAELSTRRDQEAGIGRRGHGTRGVSRRSGRGNRPARGRPEASRPAGVPAMVAVCARLAAPPVPRPAGRGRAGGTGTGRRRRGGGGRGVVGPWLKGPVPAIAELAAASIAALAAESELLPASGEIETAEPFRGVATPAFGVLATPDPLDGRRDRRGRSRRRRDGATRSGQGHRGPRCFAGPKRPGPAEPGGGAGCAGPEPAAPAAAGSDRP